MIKTISGTVSVAGSFAAGATIAVDVEAERLRFRQAEPAAIQPVAPAMVG